jgi:hypothetical protein
MTMAPERPTAAFRDADYEVAPLDTEGVDVKTSSTIVLGVHPDLAQIRTRLGAGTITKSEIRNAFLTAVPNLLADLQAAKAQTERRRNRGR